MRITRVANQPQHDMGTKRQEAAGATVTVHTPTVMTSEASNGMEPRRPSTLDAASPEALIAQAIDRGVPVETMERLLAMRRELRAERAKGAYDIAMAAFQAECPQIKKTGVVKDYSGNVLYRYAPLETIVDQVKEPLRKHGFSYSTKMDLKENGVLVTVRATHTGGHSEEYSMEVPFGNKTKAMSDTQLTAAAQTFAKRYAFCNAFGILTAADDTDGHIAPPAGNIPPSPQPPAHPATMPMSPGQQRMIYAMMRERNVPKDKLEAHIQRHLGAQGISDMTMVQARKLIAMLEKMPRAPQDDVPTVQMDEVDSLPDSRNEM